ncbi:GntR family transcriptional regulator [Streptomyces nigrescens]|uniref:GntR family transcriptional regulator n=2 Tax=Streptomyces TaxID=1883 RepID=A0ABM7ZSE0_STRNI|nr:TetR/AcrR family transcriptional regulator C-terminal domain-containing protein [Streptomyces nigrescens]MEE4418359.1 TetR/AcrR family transcriptional regulator C-terminal domain-containing protein [Streptomyces sp. DSM 41528]BDM69289.1 GntR family transcriptional regulator [Streptomyces nigrescens]
MAVKSDPPFRRIADEIARRIDEGELAPGERVPSTRQIARDWGVALATATKALTALRLAGLVEARPRVGTVVAAKERAVSEGGRPPAKRQPPSSSSSSSPFPSPPHGSSDRELTRERIVRAALDIADGEGLAAVSMRSVAARLGVAAMSPYRYVNSKDDLVLLMADAAFGEEGYPVEPPEGWRARLELGARTLWRIYRRHPWLAQVGSLTRPLMLPALMVHAEWALAALDGHGLDPATMLDLHILLYSYLHGIAVHLEREAQAEAATGLSEDQWMDHQTPAFEAIAAATRYPVFGRITDSLKDGYDLDLDTFFEFGLKPLLDGIALIIEAPPTARRPA